MMNNDETTIKIEKLLNWGAPKRIMTKSGPRDLLVAKVTPEFRALWKGHKPELRDAGLAWEIDKTKPENSPERFTGNIQWWRQLPDAAASEVASRAKTTALSFPAPEGIDYFPFQKAGIEFALGRSGTLIGDEMGLGKTVQAIGVINADESIKRVLIVCPASLKLNWAKELNRWLVRKLTISIVSGQKGSLPTDGIVIVNYDLLSYREKQLTAFEWDLVVLDESHYIKERTTKRAQAVAGVWVKAGQEVKHPGIRAKRRIAMTGTPILNKPIELFETLRWLDPSWAPRRWFYAKTYCAAFQGAWGWDESGASNLEELQRVLRQTVMVRRLKSEVLTELPPKQRQVVEFETSAELRAVIEAELAEWEKREEKLLSLKAAREIAAAGNDKAAYEAAVAALKEATAVTFEEMAAVRHATAVAKLPAVIDFCKETLEGSGEKLVIFAHHYDAIDGLCEALAEFGVVRCDGRMSAKEKDASVTAFQMPEEERKALQLPKVRVFVGSIRAAGVGITLTESSHVIFAELDWVPGVVTQAEDRCHRIGQLESVQVQHLVLEGSLDARMAHVLVEKQRIADRALDNKLTPVKAQATSVNAPVSAPQPSGDTMTLTQIKAAHRAMQMLAGVCDGAASLDGQGFNKLDTHFGKQLALQHSLSLKQAKIAAKLAQKYRKQLGSEIIAQIFGAK